MQDKYYTCNMPDKKYAPLYSYHKSFIRLFSLIKIITGWLAETHTKNLCVLLYNFMQYYIMESEIDDKHFHNYQRNVSDDYQNLVHHLGIKYSL